MQTESSTPYINFSLSSNNGLNCQNILISNWSCLDLFVCFLAEKPEAYDSTGRTNYLRMCREMGLTPVSYFLRYIVTTKIDLKHHGLSHQAVRAMAIALVVRATSVYAHPSNKPRG